MGLDSFKSDSTSRSTSSTSTSKKKQNNKQEVSEEDAYKVFSASDGRKKVIETEEQWSQIVDFIENEIGMSESEVVNMQPTQRHDVLHQAIIGEEGELSNDFYPTRYCMVCDDVFSFPSKWNFVKFKGQAVCRDHTVKDVWEKYNEMNELD